MPLTGGEGKKWFTRREQVGHGGQGALHCGRGTDTRDLQHPQERLPAGLKTLRQMLELCGCEGPSPPTSKGHIEDGPRRLCLEPLETWILIVTRNFHDGFMAIRFSWRTHGAIWDNTARLQHATYEELAGCQNDLRMCR